MLCYRFPPPHRHHFTCFVVSKWRNFSSNNQQMKVDPLPLHPSNPNTKLLRTLASQKNRSVYALRIGNFRSEIDMLSLLNECGRDGSSHAAMLKRAPLLPMLLHGAHWAHFRDHYDSTLGWLDGAERMAAESRAMQSLRQTRLLPSGQVSAVPKPGASAAGFVPLMDPGANLMPTVAVSAETITSIKQDVLDRFAPNEDQQKVLDSAAGWFWTEVEETQPDGTKRTVLRPPTSQPVQLAHGCFGSGQFLVPFSLLGCVVNCFFVVSKPQLTFFRMLFCFLAVTRQIDSDRRADCVPDSRAGHRGPRVQDQDYDCSAHQRRRYERHRNNIPSGFASHGTDRARWSTLILRLIPFCFAVRAHDVSGRHSDGPSKIGHRVCACGFDQESRASDSELDDPHGDEREGIQQPVGVRTHSDRRSACKAGRDELEQRPGCDG